MIWILIVILIIVAISAMNRSGKKNKIEVEKLKMEMQNLEEQKLINRLEPGKRLLKEKKSNKYFTCPLKEFNELIENNKISNYIIIK